MTSLVPLIGSFIGMISSSLRDRQEASHFSSQNPRAGVRGRRGGKNDTSDGKRISYQNKKVNLVRINMTDAFTQ